MKRACKALNEKGKACKQQPLVGGEYCFWHDPAYEKQAAEARRAGGANHAREQTLKGVYAFLGVQTVEDLQRLVEIAAVGLLALDNTVARDRALLGVAATGAKLLEVRELAERVGALEVALGARPATVVNLNVSQQNATLTRVLGSDEAAVAARHLLEVIGNDDGD